MISYACTDTNEFVWFVFVLKEIEEKIKEGKKLNLKKRDMFTFQHNIAVSFVCYEIQHIIFNLFWSYIHLFFISVFDKNVAPIFLGSSTEHHCI